MTLHDPFALFDMVTRSTNVKSYPPYSIIQNQKSKTTKIVIAVAGYDSKEIDIKQKGQLLTIEGGKKTILEEDEIFVHQGISGRAFKLSFTMSDTTKVDSAKFDNGLLSIVLSEDEEKVLSIPIK